MNVAIVHYHLRRGGVTSVIEAASIALRRAGIAHVVLSGTPYEGRGDLPVEVVPELDYGPSKRAISGVTLAVWLRDAARRRLGAAPDVWHIHNPALGKNALFQRLLIELARLRERLVLQHHDFAEDGRPGNYYLLRNEPHLYPVAPQIRHVAINSRDRRLLVEAGIPEEQTSLLPNAMVPLPIQPGPADPGLPPTVVYPVRGIRRKNLGELCLLAALAPDGARFAQTLEPENPEWQDIFAQWSWTASRHRLPVQFGVVNRVPPSPHEPPTYESWLSHATHLVTTSTAEGFGLAFLAPLELRRPLLGRDLPEITDDFKAHGLDLGDLYEDLLIPADWIDAQALFRSLEKILERHYHHYNVELTNVLLGETFECLRLGDYLDFGNLPESLQRQALARALDSPGDVMIGRGGSAQPAAPWLAEALSQTAPRSDCALLDHYSIARYADRLAAIYRDLERADPAPLDWLDKSKILAQFLQPERFHFLRS